MNYDKVTIQSLMIFSAKTLINQAYEEVVCPEFTAKLINAHADGLVETDKWKEALDELGTKILDLIFEAAERYIND